MKYKIILILIFGIFMISLVRAGCGDCFAQFQDYPCADPDTPGICAKCSPSSPEPFCYMVSKCTGQIACKSDEFQGLACGGSCYCEDSYQSSGCCGDAYSGVVYDTNTQKCCNSESGLVCSGGYESGPTGPNNPQCCDTDLDYKADTCCSSDKPYCNPVYSSPTLFNPQGELVGRECVECRSDDDCPGEKICCQKTHECISPNGKGTEICGNYELINDPVFGTYYAPVDDDCDGKIDCEDPDCEEKETKLDFVSPEDYTCGACIRTSDNSKKCCASKNTLSNGHIRISNPVLSDECEGSKVEVDYSYCYEGTAVENSRPLMNPDERFLNDYTCCFYYYPLMGLAYSFHKWVKKEDCTGLYFSPVDSSFCSSIPPPIDQVYIEILPKKDIPNERYYYQATEQGGEDSEIKVYTIDEHNPPPEEKRTETLKDKLKCTFSASRENRLKIDDEMGTLISYSSPEEGYFNPPKQLGEGDCKGFKLRERYSVKDDLPVTFYSGKINISDDGSLVDGAVCTNENIKSRFYNPDLVVCPAEVKYEGYITADVDINTEYCTEKKNLFPDNLNAHAELSFKTTKADYANGDGLPSQLEIVVKIEGDVYNPSVIGDFIRFGPCYTAIDKVASEIGSMASEMRAFFDLQGDTSGVIVFYPDGLFDYSDYDLPLLLFSPKILRDAVCRHALPLTFPKREKGTAVYFARIVVQKDLHFTRQESLYVKGYGSQFTAIDISGQGDLGGKELPQGFFGKIKRWIGSDKILWMKKQAYFNKILFPISKKFQSIKKHDVKGDGRKKKIKNDDGSIKKKSKTYLKWDPSEDKYVYVTATLDAGTYTSKTVIDVDRGLWPKLISFTEECVRPSLVWRTISSEDSTYVIRSYEDDFNPDGIAYILDFDKEVLKDINKSFDIEKYRGSSKEFYSVFVLNTTTVNENCDVYVYDEEEFEVPLSGIVYESKDEIMRITVPEGAFSEEATGRLKKVSLMNCDFPSQENLFFSDSFSDYEVADFVMNQSIDEIHPEVDVYYWRLGLSDMREALEKIDYYVDLIKPT